MRDPVYPAISIGHRRRESISDKFVIFDGAKAIELDSRVSIADNKARDRE